MKSYRLSNKIKRYNNEIKEIIDKLEKCNINFDEFDNDMFYDLIDNFESLYKKNFQYNNGATKGVLIFPDYKFVIKIPFVFLDGDIMIGASIGNNKEEDWDYCKIETLRYEEAQKWNLEEFFAETKLLTKINNHPIYIQELANIGSQIDIFKNKNKEKSANKINTINRKSHYSYIDTNWETDLFLLRGEICFRKLKNFIKKNDINDLRDDNIGYINRRPVIVDYSGFYD